MGCGNAGSAGERHCNCQQTVDASTSDLQIFGYDNLTSNSESILQEASSPGEVFDASGDRQYILVYDILSIEKKNSSFSKKATEINKVMALITIVFGFVLVTYQATAATIQNTTPSKVILVASNWADSKFGLVSHAKRGIMAHPPLPMNFQNIFLLNIEETSNG